MSPTRLQTRAVAEFSCLGDACPDTCCQGWGMQLTAQTIEKYQREAPELMESVTSGEAEFIMKRDAATGYCVKFEAGWCGIQRQYGAEFLGDACYFFPRVTRALGETVLTTVALSCPETARLLLYGEDALALLPREEIRVPYSLRNYLPAGLTDEAALLVHRMLIEAAGDENFSAERNLMRVSATVRALEMLPSVDWAGAVPFYLKMADGRVPAREVDERDLFFLLHALYGLMRAASARRPQLQALVERLAMALGVTFDHENNGLQLEADAMQRGLRLLHRSRAQAPQLQPVLKRYLQAQLAQELFPFAGIGQTFSERMTILGVRFATVKLALALLNEVPAPAEVVDVVQTLSRFTDHLADAEFSLRMYQETGWVREARLRGLVGD